MFPFPLDPVTEFLLGGFDGLCLRQLNNAFFVYNSTPPQKTYPFFIISATKKPFQMTAIHPFGLSVAGVLLHMVITQSFYMTSNLNLRG